LIAFNQGFLLKQGYISMFKTSFMEKLLLVIFIFLFIFLCIFAIYITNSINTKTLLYGTLQAEALNKTYAKYKQDNSSKSFYEVMGIGITKKYIGGATTNIYYSTDIQKIENGIILKDIKVTIIGPYIIQELTADKFVRSINLLEDKHYKEYFYNEWKALAKKHNIDFNIQF
jgi:hypothetical protein